MLMPLTDYYYEDVVEPADLEESPFVYSIDNAPVFFMAPTEAERKFFQRHKNSITRKYYKMMRFKKNISHTTFINADCAITCGEMAMILIRQSHLRRI